MNVTYISRFGRRRWRDLPQGARRAIGLVALVQVALLVTAARDLIRRPASEVRGGRKWVWLPVLAVNFAGPLAYLLLGRKRGVRGSTAAAAAA